MSLLSLQSKLTTLDEVYQHFGIAPDADNAAQQLLNAIRDQDVTHAQAQLERDVERLTCYLEQLQHDVEQIERSRAWRLGYKLMSFLKRLLGRKTSQDGFAHIDTIFEQFDHWKRARD